MKIQKSSEDYLETILILKRKNGYVRNVDIAEHLGFSKPSITHALSILQSSGLIEIDAKHHISLTSEGKEIADKVYEKHEFFRKQLIKLGVDKEVAERDACQIEHAISDESFSKLKSDECIDTGKKCHECGESLCPPKLDGN